MFVLILHQTIVELLLDVGKDGEQFKEVLLAYHTNG